MTQHPETGSRHCSFTFHVWTSFKSSHRLFAHFQLKYLIFMMLGFVWVGWVACIRSANAKLSHQFGRAKKCTIGQFITENFISQPSPLLLSDSLTCVHKVVYLTRVWRYLEPGFPTSFLGRLHSLTAVARYPPLSLAGI